MAENVTGLEPAETESNQPDSGPYVQQDGDFQGTTDPGPLPGGWPHSSATPGPGTARTQAGSPSATRTAATATSSATRAWPHEAAEKPRSNVQRGFSIRTA